MNLPLFCASDLVRWTPGAAACCCTWS